MAAHVRIGPDDPPAPIVLVGLRAVDRWNASRRTAGPAARAEALGRLSSFAFSGAVHLLALLLLLEIVWLAAPAVDEKVLTAALRRPGADGPSAPAPEPASTPEPAPAEPSAEAAPTAEAPAPPPTPVPAVEAKPEAARAEAAAAGIVDGIASYPSGDLEGASGPGFAGDRSAHGRRAAVERYGGNLASESAVELGLEWLAAHQSEDGGWCPSGYLERCPEPSFCGSGRRGPAYHATGTTGLALLAFLGAGYTHVDGKHRETVGRGIRWLLSRQDAAGLFLDPANGEESRKGMYGHGIALFALGEAALLTRDEALIQALERAVVATAQVQKSNGGWHYQPEGVSGSEFTLTVWQIMGLKAAERAGARVPPQALAKARHHVIENQAPDGGFRYAPGGSPTEGATGAGTFARCMLGLTSHGRIEDGWAWLERRTKTAPDLSRMRSWQYLYSWYYRTLVAHQLQGAAWRDWNRRLRPFLVSTQRTRGHAAGSWPFIDYEQASTVYSTALCVLMLETYYRYDPAAVDPRAAVDALVGRPDPAPATPEEERRIDAVQPPTPDVLAARERRDREEARRKISADAPEARYLAARRLAELGDREALPSMIAAARQETGRLRAAHLLFIGRLKDEGAVDFLMGEIEDPDPDIRGAATSALSAITGVYLKETLRWKDWHRSWKASRR